MPGAEGRPPRSFHDCARDILELAAAPADRDLMLAGNARRLFRLPA